MPRYKPSKKDNKRFLASLEKALAHADDDGTTALDHVTRALTRKAMMGDVAAIAMIADRLDGKPTNSDVMAIGDNVISFESIKIIAVQPRLEHHSDDEPDLIDVTPQKASK